MITLGASVSNYMGKIEEIRKSMFCLFLNFFCGFTNAFFLLIRSRHFFKVNFTNIIIGNKKNLSFTELFGVGLYVTTKSYICLCVHIYILYILILLYVGGSWRKIYWKIYWSQKDHFFGLLYILLSKIRLRSAIP